MFLWHSSAHLPTNAGLLSYRRDVVEFSAHVSDWNAPPPHIKKAGSGGEANEGNHAL